MIDFASLLLGLASLVGGGLLLVRGASDIASTYGVSPMVVGLAVVGFGTSSPELVVNTISASSGATDLAFGNVIGSNITNLALVLGAAALMMPITIQGGLVKRELPFLLLATVIMVVMALDGLLEGRPSIIGRSEAIVLVLLFGVIVYTNVLEMHRQMHDDALFDEVYDYLLIAEESGSRWKWPMALGGIAMLFVGGHYTVEGATGVALRLGIAPTAIGLFVIAIGTSLPELVTSIIAAMRNESDLALGNVVGSNLFNSLVVLPVTSMIEPIPVPKGGVVDLVVSLALAGFIVAAFFLGRARLGRVAGVFLLLVYAAYATTRLVLLD